MNRSSLQIIFQDVDGCLNPEDGEEFGVDPQWEPSPRQIEMLEAIDRAVDASPLRHFVINTGRFLPILDNIVRHIRTPKLRFLIMEHACVIHDRNTGTNLDPEAVARACGMDALATRYANLSIMRKLLHWYDIRGQAEMEPRLWRADAPARQIRKPLLRGPARRGRSGRPDPHRSPRARGLHRIGNPTTRILPLGPLHRHPARHPQDGRHRIALRPPFHRPRNALAVGDFLNDLAVFESFDQVMCPANAHPRIIDLTRSKGDRGHVSSHAYGAALLDFLGSMKPASGPGT